MEHITSNEFVELKKFMNFKYGIDLKESKINLIENRLNSTIHKRGMKNVTELIHELSKDITGNLRQELVNKLTTNHTYFMREEEHFDFLIDTAFPSILPEIKDYDLRIWSAGCSSGDEAFTIAMLLDEYLGFEKHIWNTQILATDISTPMLQKAINGVYERESLNNIPTKWINKYFDPIDNTHVQINNNIKNSVIFRYLNLSSESFPFKKKFHIIFCRNVMIYFDKSMKERLINNFYNLTEPGGFLFIGHSEYLSDITHQYSNIKPSIYQRMVSNIDEKN